VETGFILSDTFDYLCYLGYKSMARNSQNTELTFIYSRMPFAGATIYLNISTYRCQQRNVRFSTSHKDWFRT